jgi:hypothetical protein
MKYFSIIYLSLFLAFLSFTSCGSSSNNSKTEEIASDDSNEDDEDKPKKKKKKKLSEDELILGTWEASMQDRIVKFIFKNGGRFSAVIYEDDQIIESGTGEYEIIDSELIISDDKSSKPSAAKIISIDNDKLVVEVEIEGEITKIVYKRID